MTNAAAAAAFNSPQFAQILLSLRLQSLTHDLPSLELSSTPVPVNWNFALLCASALTSDDSEAAQIAVLRVASGCLSDLNTTPEQRIAAAALLERDGNSPAVRLAEHNGMVPVDAWPALPLAMQLEVVKSKLQHSVALSTGEVLSVNSFQSELWLDAGDSDWLSVSAPTSSGKSRILREWFLEQLRLHEHYSAVYLVPTRALVEEVSAAFRKTVGSATSVFMMPWDSSVHSAQNRVLVLTQERLHLIQSTHPNFKVDLLFIDEAQGLGGAHRGILLQQVLDRTAVANPEVQVIFASPLSSNPEILLADLPDGVRATSFTSETVTVNQNLLRVELRRGFPDVRDIALVHGGEPLPIGTLTIPERPQGVFGRLATTAYLLGHQNGGNIVYANRPDDAEKIAQALYSLSPALTSVDPEIAELQSLIRTAVHPSYDLIEVLSRGVAFHYGNMPLAIRAEIERLFEEEKIRFLVCTSTLLEGVNLPCKNIFIRAPRKGQKNPMSEMDFWNLAGRAGRWGKEFQGNVICIDTRDAKGWPIFVPTVRGRFELRRAVRAGLGDPNRLLEYLDASREQVGGDSDSEHLLSYLAARYVNGSDLSRELASITDDEKRAAVSARVQAVVDASDIPPELIPRHAGISPIAMSKLLESFRATGKPAQSFVLPKPLHPNAKEIYQDAYVRLGATMTNDFGLKPQFGDDKRKWQIAALVLNWMKGMPLKTLIEQRANSHPLPKAIRDVMSDIETVVRFQSAKYLACYHDVLSVYAMERDEGSAQPNFDVTMMLELGVSRQSLVRLMSLGLSRTTTIAIESLIAPDDWTAEEATSWLRNTNFATVKMPVTLRREIEALQEQYARSSESRPPADPLGFWAR